MREFGDGTVVGEECRGSGCLPSWLWQKVVGGYGVTWQVGEGTSAAIGVVLQGVGLRLKQRG